MWIYNIEDVFNFGTSIISFPNVNEISTICEDVFNSEICITSNTERLLVSWQKESMCQGGVAYFDSSVDNTVTPGQTQLLSWLNFWFYVMEFILSLLGPSFLPLWADEEFGF